MAALATTLTLFSDKENSRTWTTTGHTAARPKLVIQKRRVPAGSQIIQEDTISVIQAGVDAAGLTLPQKVSFQLQVRQPITMVGSTVSDALAIFRDVVQSTEFGTTVTGSLYLK